MYRPAASAQPTELAYSTRGNYTQALVKHRAEWTVRDGSGKRLEVVWGRLETPLRQPTPFHLHWYQPAQPARCRAAVQYQAAYLWDLHLDASRLTAWLRYHVPEGAVKTLQVDLPADLDVRSADIQRTPLPSALAPAWLAGIRLSDWHVVAASRKAPPSVSNRWALFLVIILDILATSAKGWCSPISARASRPSTTRAVFSARKAAR